MNSIKPRYCAINVIAHRLKQLTGKFSIYNDVTCQYSYGFLTPEIQECIKKEGLTQYFGLDKNHPEGYFVFIARDSQQEDYNYILRECKTVFAEVEEVHRSPKFCNPNYFYGNILQMMIVRIKYEEQ